MIEYNQKELVEMGYGSERRLTAAPAVRVIFKMDLLCFHIPAAKFLTIRADQRRLRQGIFLQT